MAVTTLSTQIFQYREDTANPPVTTTLTPGQTTVTNTLVGNIAVTGSPTTSVVGNYQIITFTGSGSFTPTVGGNVELMMVAGGGASTYPNAGYGGSGTPGASAGGLIYYGSNPWEFKSGPAITLSAGTTYTVTIGGGATAQAQNLSMTPALAAGSNTSISGGSINLIAYGGQGTTYYFGTQANTGNSGAPGAGGSYWRPGYAVASPFVYFYTGINPAPNQGYQGGPGIYNAASAFVQPGGGGAGSAGAPQSYNALSSHNGWGWGGNGFLTDISGTTSWYGGGGGGGSVSAGSAFGPGGQGGGGNGGTGANPGPNNGSNGVTNTGGGGGGAGFYYNAGGGGTYVYGTSGNGGSGVLILKIPIYNITPDAVNAIQQNAIAVGNTATGGASITYSGNYRIHTFTSSGTFTAQHTGYIQYLVVAGGGGGCAGYRGSVGGANGGSGGGGGYLEYYQSDNEYGDLKGPRLTVTTGDIISVVIGGGGTSGFYGAGVGSATPTTNGSGSYLYNNTTKQYVYSLGGGGGGCGVTGAASMNASWDGAGLNQGKSGGSGGGGAYIAPNETSGTDDQNLGGGGIAQGWPVQGYNGSYGANNQYGVGGGAGGAASGSTPGPGRAATITGASVTYAAGGPRNATATATNATANTGNGGQGGNYQVVGQTNPGSNGGSGIVIIRYKFQ